MSAAGSDNAREEGSEAAESNGFSSLGTVFAQRRETCRATDTLRDISPSNANTADLHLSLSKRSVEVGTVRSVIRGGGWGEGGWREAGERRGHGRIWGGDLRDSRGSCAKEAGLKAAAGTLSLQFPLPPTDRSERLCKFLRSLRRLRGRQ